jgi:xanthine dehydrogenase accessory factor
VLRREVGDGAFVVVATQGQRDLQGLRAALALRAGGVWFVASARKAAVLRESLIAAGADAAAVQSIVAPAGTPISARTPPEIALSVLAAVVAARRAGLPHGLGGDAAGAPVSEPGDSADRAPASCCAQRAAPVEAAVPEAGSCCSHSVPPVAAAEQPAPAAATSHSCCGH